MGSKELSGDGCTYGKGMALSKRTARVFHATCYVKLGVTRRGRAPLTQCLQFFEAILANQAQLAIEHGSHVSGVKVEAVATYPHGIFGVILQILAVKYIDKIGTTHGASGVATLGLFYCTGSQNTDIIGCVIQYFNVIHNQRNYCFNVFIRAKIRKLCENRNKKAFYFNFLALMTSTMQSTSSA